MVHLDRITGPPAIPPFQRGRVLQDLVVVRNWFPLCKWSNGPIPHEFLNIHPRSPLQMLSNTITQITILCLRNEFHKKYDFVPLNAGYTGFLRRTSLKVIVLLTLALAGSHRLVSMTRVYLPRYTRDQTITHKFCKAEFRSKPFLVGFLAQVPGIQCYVGLYKAVWVGRSFGR